MQVSILVNNAGVVTGRKFLDITDQMIIRTMDVNIMSHFWVGKSKRSKNFTILLN
jgi:all-trans-retinol dehydrogenase (NAD+)